MMIDLLKHNMVEVSSNMLEKILEWAKEQNGQFDDDILLTEGIMHIKGEEYTEYLYFNFDDSADASVSIQVEDKHLMDYKLIDGQLKIVNPPVLPPHLSDIEKALIINDAMRFGMARILHILLYITHFESQEQYIAQSSSRVLSKPAGQKSSSKKKRKRVYINKKKYTISSVSDIPKQSGYTRRTEVWGVRPHFRHYKSGKVVQIQPYVKGDRSKAHLLDPVTYVLSDPK